ncbi:Ldh family oxidoreductase [Streptomyces tubbatahanensis]|uniref:Ldh family oxidoreductase n=1 Tax=Streptomyces tubbatahanensis TaxID=2923272 RepID=A0ABY3XMX1_9ACTN|nr:Ldh family oxidoreductase [Streptomyces tubbatahanensis]UNS95734.1 Ldh family oxidoreductase [Streptomyces tubbatahanensis]
MSTVIPPPATRAGGQVRVAPNDLLDFTAGVFRARGVPAVRARTAAEALVHGDLTGITSHGLVNLTRLYLPLFDDGRCDPAAEPRTVTDAGASVLLDAGRALGLWAAAEAVDLAAERARLHGVGLVSVRDATHLGCAGAHALRAARAGLICLLVSNCGRQRITRPPGARAAMLGTNPLAFAAPAGDQPPFVLDMSTTAVPTGRIRGAARAGRAIPPGWLVDDQGRPVTDPGALDRGEAFLTWLGGAPETGAYKGYGLGLLVEVLGALLPGAGLGPAPEAWAGGGGPTGRDDDIGFAALVVAPGRLRARDEFDRQADGLFRALTGAPALSEDRPVRYPGWHEARRAAEHARTGVPLPGALYAELRATADALGLPVPQPVDPADPMNPTDSTDSMNPTDSTEEPR